MNHTAIVKKLEKTRNSIENAMQRGVSMRNVHGQILSDRYTSLKRELLQSDIPWEQIGLVDNSAGVKAWADYCAKYEFSLSHQGYDFFAD